MEIEKEKKVRIPVEWLLRDYEDTQTLMCTKAYRRYCRKNNLEEGDGVGAFLETVEGQQIMEQLKGLHGHVGAICTPKFIRGPQGKEQYVSLMIDLTFPKERIRADFNYILNECYSEAEVERPLTPPRGGKIMEMEEADKMRRAYNSVEEHLINGETEHQSIMKATLQLHTDKRPPRLEDPPANDKRYQQVKRWHQKVKSKIGNL